MSEALLTTTDVSEMLGVHPRTVRQWAADRTLPHYDFGDAYRFKRADIELWIESKYRAVGSTSKKKDPAATGSQRK